MTSARRLFRGGLRTRMRRAFYDLRVEGSGPGRDAASVGLGVFVGCLPIYGFHLLLCWVLGWLFRLNRLKVYLAANISNPFIAPWLLFAELQVGAWLRHGAFQSLAPRAISATGWDVVLIDLIVGSLAVGAVLAGFAAAATYALVRRSGDDDDFLDLIGRAADRYVNASIIAWEFARGKLRSDPIYRATLCGGIVPSGGTLIDLGCGQGLMLALLAEARRSQAAGIWPASWPAPPSFDRMIGVEIRARVATTARQALGAEAEIVRADATAAQVGDIRAALVFDMLQMIAFGEQETILARLAARLDRDGVILIREADPGAGWRFQMVRAGNRLKAIVFGHWRQRFYFRRRADWIAVFARHGLTAEVQTMGEGTPFANVLYLLRPAARPAGPSSGRTGTSTPGAA